MVLYICHLIPITIFGKLLAKITTEYQYFKILNFSKIAFRSKLICKKNLAEKIYLLNL